MITDINSEDRLVQRTFAEHLEKVLGWESVYVYVSHDPAGKGLVRADMAAMNPNTISQEHVVLRKKFF